MRPATPPISPPRDMADARRLSALGNKVMAAVPDISGGDMLMVCSLILNRLITMEPNPATREILTSAVMTMIRPLSALDR